MHSNIEDRAKEVVNRFTQIEDWEDRYREIIKFGKSLPNLDESLKVEDYKVKGCQSQVCYIKPKRVLFILRPTATLPLSKGLFP